MCIRDSYLANKIATQIIDKLFDAGDLQISYFPPATDEEVMVAELARLMTLMSTYEDKEEYEKAAIIKRKIERLQTKYENYDKTHASA